MPLGRVFGREIESDVGLARVVHWIYGYNGSPFPSGPTANQRTIHEVGVQLYVVLGTRPALNGMVLRAGSSSDMGQARDNLFGLERLG